MLLKANGAIKVKRFLLLLLFLPLPDLDKLNAIVLWKTLTSIIQLQTFSTFKNSTSAMQYIKQLILLQSAFYPELNSIRQTQNPAEPRI